MLPRHIIWDWNGTLLSDVEAGLNAVNAMLLKRRLPRLTLERYRETFGFPVRHFYETSGFRLAEENWDAMAEEYHALFLADPTLRLHPSARKVLGYFAGRGIPQSILSVMERTRLAKMLGDYGLGPFFAQVCGGGDLYGVSKTSLGARLVERLGLPSASLLLIGDTLHDAEVAAALSIPCLLVAGGHQSAARLRASGQTVLADLSEVPAWFSGMGENRD